MHNSYNIPLPGRKLLPLTQTTPHPCTRVKNCSVTKKKDKTPTNRQTDCPPPLFSLCSSPFSEHEMPSLLPETALAWKLPAAFDKSWSNGGWIRGLLCTASPPPPSLLAVPSRAAGGEDGARWWPRLWGCPGGAPEPRGACACPGPSIGSARPAEGEAPQGNSRAPHPTCPSENNPVPMGPAGLHRSPVTSPASLGRAPSSHPRANFPNSGAA